MYSYLSSSKKIVTFSWPFCLKEAKIHSSMVPIVVCKIFSFSIKKFTLTTNLAQSSFSSILISYNSNVLVLDWRAQLFNPSFKVPRTGNLDGAPLFFLKKTPQTQSEIHIIITIYMYIYIYRLISLLNYVNDFYSQCYKNRHGWNIHIQLVYRALDHQSKKNVSFSYFLYIHTNLFRLLFSSPESL